MNNQDEDLKLKPSGGFVCQTIGIIDGTIMTDMFILALKVGIMIRYQIKAEAPLPAVRQSRFIGMLWVSGLIPPLNEREIITAL